MFIENRSTQQVKYRNRLWNTFLSPLSIIIFLDIFFRRRSIKMYRIIFVVKTRVIFRYDNYSNLKRNDPKKGLYDNGK